MTTKSEGAGVWGIVRFYLRVFFWMALPVGVVSVAAAAAGSESDTRADAVLRAVLLGICFGITMSLGVGSTHLLKARRRGQKDPSRMRHESEVMVRCGPTQAFEMCLVAIGGLQNRPRIQERRPDTIVARTGWTWESFGERVEVVLRPVEGGTAVQITSRPRVVMTLMDYGRNYLNVKAICGVLQCS